MIDIDRIELEMLITQREAMIAENNRTLIMGTPPNYGEIHFLELRDRFGELIERHKRLISKRSFRKGNKT